MTTVMLAGGGSGGHIYPLIAIADALCRLAPSLQLVFVGTEKGYEKSLVPARGYQLVMTPVRPLRGVGWWGTVRGASSAAHSLWVCRRLLRAHRPRAVVTVGGYAAGPISLAAFLGNIPVFLLEPNAVMGLANRLIAPLATRGYTAFASPERHFRAGRVRRLGLPLRPGFSQVPYAIDPGSPRLLVLGGSQGARSLNLAVPKAVAQLRRRVSVTHQTGHEHAAEVKESARMLGLTDYQVCPYIDDMPRSLAATDLVISRSGAGAVSEICAIGRPSVLVPFPYAAGDHQTKNAREIAEAGAAVLVPNSEQLASSLTGTLERLLADPVLLEQMASAAVRLGRSNAASEVARDLLQAAQLMDASPTFARRTTNSDANLEDV